MTTINSFDDMGLKEDILRGIYAYGMEEPSSIQKKAIKPGLEGRDLLIQSQSGTGKTGAFSITALNKIENEINKTQVLVLSPTRDLAIQTGEVFSSLGKYLNISVHVSIGGRSSKEDCEELKKNPDVVTGTPGRILDNINRNNLNMKNIKIFIIDEVDVMLDRGFTESMQQIFDTVKDTTQVIVASATYKEETHTICNKILRNPIKIETNKEEITLQGISQFYIQCDQTEFKREVILDLYEKISITQCVIFVNTKRDSEIIGSFLNERDFTVSIINGELEQNERDDILKDFISGKTRILISTDILSRGIDVQQVSIVINYDLPVSTENYIHRIGRSGRFGRKGVSINLIASENKRYDEVKRMKEIESFYSTEIKEMPLDFSDYL